MVGASPHLFRPMYPDFLHGAPPTSACAAFIKESRIKFANASKLDRKSGVRCCEHGAPVLFPVGPLQGAGLSARAEVSQRTAGLALEFDSSGELQSSRR